MGQWAQDILSAAGYPALALIILLENLFPPIPSEAILPFAGFQVSQGVMIFPLAVLAATFGSVVGALALYALGRIGGRPVLLRWGRVLRLDKRRLDRADDWFDEHGPKVVFFGRMLPGVRSAVSIPAGISEMPLVSFVALTAAGSAIWNAALIGAGWALGDRWHDVTAAIEQAGPLAVAAVALLAVAALGVYFVRKRRRAQAH